MLSVAPNSKHLRHYGSELQQTKPEKNPNRQLENLRPAALHRRGGGVSSLPANYITKTVFNQVSAATSATPTHPGGFLLSLTSCSGFMEDLGWERKKGKGMRVKCRYAPESHDNWCISTAGVPGKYWGWRYTGTVPSLGPLDGRFFTVLKTSVMLVERRDASGISLRCATVSANWPEKQDSP